MTFTNWREAAEALAAATNAATPSQRKLAQHTGTPIPLYTPKIVASAMLRLSLTEELSLSISNFLSHRYEARIQGLRRRSDPAIEPQTDEEAVAWITYLRLVRRREAITRLKLEEGDAVETKDGELAEVSSIGYDGKVFFKGGRGFRAWPDLINMIARKNENSDSATLARQHARNMAALRQSPSDWSLAKRNDLSEFAAKNIISEDDITELEGVIMKAKDERPIQKFLEANQHLLTALLEGQERYCIPLKRLGSEHVPDFIIGDVNSLGVRWVLVELETPRSGIYLKDGLLLDAKARKGVSQIADWRNWLSDNIAYARERRSENGLGLFDIREMAEALVIVGRRSRMPPTKDAQRIEYRQSNRIKIHSYDWLVESLRGAIRHSGPPAVNHYTIPRTQP